MAPGAQSRKRQHYDEANLTPTLRGIGNNPVVDRLPVEVEMDSNGYLTNETMSNTSMNSTNSTNMEIQTFSTEMARSSSNITGGRGHHGETQVTKKTTRFNPIDETEQVIMPYRSYGQMTFNSQQGYATTLTFRLNSIYDIRHAGETFNVEKTPGPDTPDAAGSIEIPHYRDYWSKLYNYWHVVKCDWKFHFRYQTLVDNTLDLDMCLIFYEHGLQSPPISASVAPIPAATQNIPWYIRKYHPHVRKMDVPVYLNAASNGNIPKNKQWSTQSGTFRPGNIAHEVVEDEYNQIWHKWAETPPTAEKLTIMLQPNDRAMLNANYTNYANMVLNWYMEMEYTVQLKDRIHTFQYLTQGTDFPGTDNIILEVPPL